MILIGGVTPRLKLVDDWPQICPVCGLAQARVKRVDHWLTLFFIPVLRVKKGEPFLMCDRCERSIRDMDEEYRDALERAGGPCEGCARTLHPDYRYCPYCGKKR